jgi:hypothetical protein
MEHTSTPVKCASDEKQSVLDPLRAGIAESSANAAARMGETASNAGAAVAQSAAGVASFVGRKAEDAASYVGHRADDAVAYVGQRSGEASAAMGSGLRSLGDTVRERGPEGGMAGNASAAIANSLESSGRYLQDEGIKDMAEDVTNLVRRNPIPALLIGVAAGFLAGRATTPRN